MLSTIILWSYIFFLSFIFGFSIFHIVHLKANTIQPNVISICILSLIGLVGLSAINGFFSLVINIGLLANLILGLSAIGLFIWQRFAIIQYLKDIFQNIHRMHLLTIIAFLAITLVILIKAVQLPQNYDSGLYHAQAIRWIETYRVIPGLGNLHDRLVFNSNWLLLSAFFSFSFLGVQSFHNLGGFLAVLISAYSLGKFDRLMKGEISFSYFAAIFIPLFLRRLFSLELSSPGTDLPSALLIWIIFLIAIEKIEKGQTRKFDSYYLVILILSLFVVTVKLSTIPVLLLPAYFTLRQEDRLKSSFWLMVAAIAVFIFLPWTGRSLIESGYPVYPISQLNIIRADWQILDENARGTQEWIQSWAKIPSPYHEAVQQMSPITWVPIWYQNLEAVDRQVLWASLLALGFLIVALGLLIVLKRINIKELMPFGIIYTATILGVIYWFIQAPAMRFGYGFLGLLIIICLSLPIAKVISNIGWLKKLGATTVLIALILYQGVSFYRALDFSTLKTYLVLPADYPTVESVAQTVGDITIYTPTNGDQCWYTSFPCVPAIDTHLRTRGGSLLDGFWMLP